MVVRISLLRSVTWQIILATLAYSTEAKVMKELTDEEVNLIVNANYTGALEPRLTTAPADSVIFKVYWGPRINDYDTINYNDVDGLKKSHYIDEFPLIVLIHGFLGPGDDFPAPLIDAYVTRGVVSSSEQANVLMVDWSDLSGTGITDYISAVSNIGNVARRVAEFLIFLRYAESLCAFEHVHLVGFSLGAHIAGIAGYVLSEYTALQLGRISGLDPAGPGFDDTTVAKLRKLSDDDAHIVDVLHTNGGKLGTTERSGHIDVFVNGGESQPGCAPEITFACSHAESTKIFSRSIVQTVLFKACLCDNGNWNQRNKCSKDPICDRGGVTILAGEYTPQELLSTGVYYLTN